LPQEGGRGTKWDQTKVAQPGRAKGGLEKDVRAFAPERVGGGKKNVVELEKASPSGGGGVAQLFTKIRGNGISGRGGNMRLKGEFDFGGGWFFFVVCWGCFLFFFVWGFFFFFCKRLRTTGVEQPDQGRSGSTRQENWVKVRGTRMKEGTWR